MTATAGFVYPIAQGYHSQSRNQPLLRLAAAFPTIISVLYLFFWNLPLAEILPCTGTAFHPVKM